MLNLLEELNTRQREAVERTEGPILILAGAGSGKTRVITFRIAHLIEACRVPPESVLALTFTNKAADQMKERVAKLLGQLDRPPHISTFHSLCVRVLRREIERLGYTRNFTIYDADDQLRVVKGALEELGLSEQVVSSRAALARISYSKNRGQSPAELYQGAFDPLTEKLASLYERYEAKLRQANALDFDDLLLKTAHLFDSSPEVSERWTKMSRYILVDEYQDTNRIQYRLICLLTREHHNLCVVGDEDQSIYRWRGADIENILSFEKDYPEARVIRLEQNYRSTQLILDAATAVVRNNLARKGKTLHTQRGQGQPLGLFEARDAEEEALFVCGQVAHALSAGEDGSVAVLYRTNAQSRVFEEALRLSGINYRVVGGFSFYERAEVKDILAYARLANNQRDDVAFRRVVNTPPRGIGETTLVALEGRAREEKLTLWEALEQEIRGGSSSLAPRAAKALESFCRLLQEIIQARDPAGGGMSGFFKRILEKSGYLAMLRAETGPEAQERIENLNELVSAAAEAENRGETLAEFLDHAAMLSDADAYDERARVTLMTLHSAKGLEFSTVILAGLEEGLFPHKLSLQDAAALEEERRLCYVGMTRARDRLILSWARQRRAFGLEAYGSTQPSRFLREVPQELLEPLTSFSRGAKPRRAWANAANSLESVESFLRERGHTSTIPRGPVESARLRRSSRRQWELGTQVRHAKYGVGTVVGCEGEGEEAKVTVSFPGYGRKKLVERYASLQRA